MQRVRGSAARGRAVRGTATLGTVLCLVVAAIAPVARADEPDLGTGMDRKWMETLEAKIDDHLWWGQLAEITYGSPKRVPGDVVSGGAWGDSGLWTGTYMAAQAFRYAVAQQKIVAGEGAGYWEAQRDEALDRLRVMVDKYHLLVNIADGWVHTSEPYVDPDDKQPIGFGGGVITGEKGMLMRACTPESGAPGIRIEPGGNRRIFGPFGWNGESWYCETAPSRDTYAGTTFGLLTAYDLVGDALGDGRREQIREDVLAMATFLVKYGWNYPRPHGYVSIPEVNDGHDFDNFISPLFVYVPMARLNMAQAARHVATGTDEQTKWDTVYAEELASQGPMLAASMEIDAVEPNAGYFKYNLHHLTGYSLVRLETDPAVRALYMQALGVMDKTTGDDVNAHFETITYALTGDESRLGDAIAHVREWREYRARIDTGVPTRNSIRCGAELACVPNDQREIGDGLVVIPGSSGQRAARPLPVADRPPTDFLWQRPPTQLDGDAGAEHEAPGVDYLLPYWMLRYHTEVAIPASNPFPPYPGPAHF